MRHPKVMKNCQEGFTGHAGGYGNLFSLAFECVLFAVNKVYENRTAQWAYKGQDATM